MGSTAGELKAEVSGPDSAGSTGADSKTDDSKVEELNSDGSKGVYPMTCPFPVSSPPNDRIFLFLKVKSVSTVYHPMQISLASIALSYKGPPLDSEFRLSAASLSCTNHSCRIQQRAAYR